MLSLVVVVLSVIESRQIKLVEVRPFTHSLTFIVWPSNITILLQMHSLLMTACQGYVSGGEIRLDAKQRGTLSSEMQDKASLV